MADKILTPQRVTDVGLTPTRIGGLLVADTHIVRNDGKTLLLFLKTAAVNCVVTVQTPAKVGGLDVAERTFTVVATTGDVAAALFPPSIYNDSVGDLRFTLSDVDGLTVAVLQL